MQLVRRRENQPGSERGWFLLNRRHCAHVDDFEQYTHAAEFRKAGYVPMTVNGTEYGETREFGNFS